MLLNCAFQLLLIHLMYPSLIKVLILEKKKKFVLVPNLRMVV